MGRRSTSELPADVRELLLRNAGVLTTAAAAGAGIPESRLRRLVATNLLTRVATGCYVDAKARSELDEWQRFALDARAFALSCPSGAYLTGWASTVVQGYPTLGRPPARPALVRPKIRRQGGMLSSRGRVRMADLPVAHRSSVGQVLLMSAAWSVADLARTAR